MIRRSSTFLQTAGRFATRGSFRYICNSPVCQDGQSASAKLFADAAREEAEETETGAAGAHRAGILSSLEDQHRNWTGEESTEDAVLRMLVDKYRPLRSGPFKTADQQLKEAPPQLHPSPVVPSTPARTWQEVANEPLLPAVKDHRPWHTTFKPPSHASASIKLGNFSPVSARTSQISDAADERTRRTEKELMKRRQQAGRLTRARESTLDYRLGLRDGGDGKSPSRTNPLSLKGWQSLVEDRIEKARMAGHFDKVKGRGQPIARITEERNPFIAREEFLMNRIVQRNGAAPPWVEVQIELETAVRSFREALRQSWTRRAIRMLTMSQSAAMLPSLSFSTVTSLRDHEWEERERSYHDTAVGELNSLVRKYNAMAPYAVRRPYYTRDAELAKAYQDCGGDILRGIAERSQEVPSRQSPRFKSKLPSHHEHTLEPGIATRLRGFILQWLEDLQKRLDTRRT
ncbi:hypothetical protein F5I97DRAFT_837424 [Phlebopus sp. FC_14]|nr:hypothetical protein F5I97DRAFT_837424 [Phlebopus sp. FC_14]